VVPETASKLKIHVVSFYETFSKPSINEAYIYPLKIIYIYIYIYMCVCVCVYEITLQADGSGAIWYFIWVLGNV
jgi:hypothetical protein